MDHIGLNHLPVTHHIRLEIIAKFATRIVAFEVYKTFCLQQTFCYGNEGWTLILKIDGNQQSFTYNSLLWSNKETFQPNNLDLDDKETKLASYWTLPFIELRLGMKVEGTTRWITFSYTASSLYSLIADGQYRETSIGKSKWRSLLPRSSLQRNCNKVSDSRIRMAIVKHYHTIMYLSYHARKLKFTCVFCNDFPLANFTVSTCK